MPLDISTNAIIEKNKLSTTNVELLLLEFQYQSEPAVRVCLNNTDITWNGYTWYPAIFSLTGVNETKDAEIPKVTLNFVDITRMIIAEIEKNGGYDGATVDIYIVDSKYLADTTPKLHETAEIIDISIDEKGLVSMSLGTENLSSMRIPKNRYMKNHCRYEFKVEYLPFYSSGINVPLVGDYILADETAPFTRLKAIVLAIDHHPISGYPSATDSGVLKVKVIEGVRFAGDLFSAYTDSGFTTLRAADVGEFASLAAAPQLEGQGRCRYTGTETECNRTFARCVELNNSARFGGFPGVGGGGILK